MGFGRILFAVFMIVPLIEIAFFVIIGNAIGLWPTLGGVFLTAIIGSLVLRFQGMAVFNDIRSQMGRGQMPARSLADAALIGAGGLMLLLPGYFSDIIGILLLLPPVRSALYAFFKTRIQFVTMGSYSTNYTARRPPDDPDTIELDDDDWRRR